MTIRPATRADLEAIAALHIESCRDAYSHVFPAEFLEERLPESLELHWKEVEIGSEDIVLIAEEEVPIGFIAVWCRPAAFIDNLHVRPSSRSKRVGTALMSAMAQRLISRGKKTAYLWVFESNIRAIRFYEKLGGITERRTDRSVFGYAVMSRRIVWNDVTSIVASGR